MFSLFAISVLASPRLVSDGELIHPVAYYPFDCGITTEDNSIPVKFHMEVETGQTMQVHKLGHSISLTFHGNDYLQLTLDSKKSKKCYHGDNYPEFEVESEGTKVTCKAYENTSD